MIIKKIRVENWRTLREPLTIEFCDGVNVIYGDNGRGKSTLMEALQMGFFDRHDVSGEEIKKVRPWGCDLYPRVEIEFLHDGAAYRLTKRFLNLKSSSVERMESSSGQYGRYMEGAAADAWLLREVMKCEGTQRGVSKSENWGLAGLLWIPQGGGGELSGLSDAVRQRVIEKKAAEEQSASCGGIEGAVKQEYLKFFTDNGHARTGAGSLRDIGVQITVKSEEFDKTLRKLEEMTALREKIRSAREEIAESQTLETAAASRVSEAETKIAEFDKIKSEGLEQRVRQSELGRRKAALAASLETIKEARAAIDRYTRNLDVKTKALEDSELRLKNISIKSSSEFKIEILAETGITVEPDARKLDRGEKTEITGTGQLRFNIPGVAAFTVTDSAAMQNALNAAKREQETANSCRREIDNCHEQLKRQRDKLAEILTDGKTEEGIRKELDGVLGELHTVDKHINELLDKANAIGGDPHKAIEKFKRDAEELRGKREAKRAEESAMTGRLEALGEMGLLQKAGELDEELRKLQTRYDTEALRSQAFKLIWDTLSSVRREFQEQVSAPVETRASELFARINRHRAGAVRLDDRFRITGFIPDGAAEVGTDNLSGGEREQLYFCARLALAEHIIGDDTAEKYTLILDDFLTVTDDSRLSRLKELLLSFENRYQYLIFTCHKNRYEGIYGKYIEI